MEDAVLRHSVSIVTYELQIIETREDIMVINLREFYPYYIGKCWIRTTLMRLQSVDLKNNTLDVVEQLALLAPQKEAAQTARRAKKAEKKHQNRAVNS